jgi:hypothetical protein
MRCDDLTRELASPTGALSSAQMAEHLAACPTCAEWSRRANRFDRIWEATRPTEPSMDALDALWARASVELDGVKAPATLKFARPNRGRRRAMVAFFAAQAAVLLVGALLLLDRGGNKPIQVADSTPDKVEPKEPEFLDLNVEPDALAVVRIAKDNEVSVEKVDLSYLYTSSSLPATPHDEVDAVETAGSKWTLVSK